MFDVHHVTLTLSENYASVEGLSGAMFHFSGAEVCYCVKVKTRVHVGRCVLSPTHCVSGSPTNISTAA